MSHKLPPRQGQVDDHSGGQQAGPHLAQPQIWSSRRWRIITPRGKSGKVWMELWGRAGKMDHGRRMEQDGWTMRGECKIYFISTEEDGPTNWEE